MYLRQGDSHPCVESSVVGHTSLSMVVVFLLVQEMFTQLVGRCSFLYFFYSCSDSDDHPPVGTSDVNDSTGGWHALIIALGTGVPE